MTQPFPKNRLTSDVTSPSLFGFAITASDSADLAAYTRSVTINSSGVIAYHDWDGVARTTGTLPAGQHPITARRILLTGTTVTAGGITGWV